MAEMLLINPQRRKSRRKTAAKRRTHARVRKNPMTMTTTVRRRVKRRNPMHMMRRHVTRRRNPIGTGMASTYLRDVREALMAGAGAVVFDIVHGQIKRFLPTSLQVTPGSIGAGDAVRAVITVVVGQALNGVTRGFSKKAAMASLTVQAHDLLKGFVPASLPLGYMSPAMVAQGTNRVGPIRGTTGMNAYMRPGPTPLLSAYTTGTPLLNGSVQRREGVSTYY
jgi:hypothetical protein